MTNFALSLVFRGKESNFVIFGATHDPYARKFKGHLVGTGKVQRAISRSVVHNFHQEAARRNVFHTFRTKARGTISAGFATLQINKY